MSLSGRSSWDSRRAGGGGGGGGGTVWDVGMWSRGTVDGGRWTVDCGLWDWGFGAVEGASACVGDHSCLPLTFPPFYIFFSATALCSTVNATASSGKKMSVTTM